MRIDSEYKIQPMELEAKPVKNKKIVQYVLLDTSGSMEGEKIFAAKKGLESIIENRLDSDVYYGEITTRRLTWYYNHNEKAFKDFSAGGGTPLLQRLLVTMNYIFKNYKEDQILLSIFTDGEDTEGLDKANMDILKGLFGEFKELGWTVTFVGEQRDIETFHNKFPQFDISNSYSVEQTGESFEEAFNARNIQFMQYTKNVQEGKDVTKGFYEKTTN